VLLFAARGGGWFVIPLFLNIQIIQDHDCSDPLTFRLRDHVIVQIP
jgi:hypothetical protein